MPFVRSFIVNVIPNEISIEKFRDSMEMFGSICRIDKTPYITDNGENLGWNAFIYYESWKPCEATSVIDDQIKNFNRRNLVCFIDTSTDESVGNIDRNLITPTITVYPISGNLIRNNKNYILMYKNHSATYTCSFALHNIIRAAAMLRMSTATLYKSLFPTIPPVDVETWMRENSHIYFDE